jgi:hypothetical protein
MNGYISRVLSLWRMKGKLELVAEENTNSVVFNHSMGLHAQEIRQIIILLSSVIVY